MVTISCGLMVLFFAGLAIHFGRKRDLIACLALAAFAAGWGTWGYSCYVDEFVTGREIEQQERILATMDHKLKTKDFPVLPPGFPIDN